MQKLEELKTPCTRRDDFWYTDLQLHKKVKLGLRAKPKLNICVNAEVDP